MDQVRVLLEPAEYQALAELAEQELRPIPNQVRAILRDRLVAAGLLDETTTPRGRSA